MSADAFYKTSSRPTGNRECPQKNTPLFLTLSVALSLICLVFSTQLGQHLGGIVGGLDLVEGFDDDPVFVDQIGDSDHAHRDLAVVLFLLPHVVGLNDLQFGDRTLQVTCSTC